MLIIRKSVFTGKVHAMEIPVTEGQISFWKSGELIQVAMPHLTPEEREFMLTGSTPEEWNEVFGEEEQNDDWIE